MKKQIFALSLLVVVGITGHATEDDEDKKWVEEFLNEAKSEYSEFVHDMNAEYSEFMREIHEEYAKFLNEDWKPFGIEEPVVNPIKDVPPVPPVVIDDDREELPPTLPIDIDTIINIPPLVVPQPQPQPIIPIPMPEEDRLPSVHIQFEIYGTPFVVSLDNSIQFRLVGCSENDVSQIWLKISEDNSVESALYQLLEIRDSHKLSDWAYLNLIKSFTSSVFPSSNNERKLLEGYMMIRSGYSVKFASSHESGRLYTLFGFKNLLYDKPYFTIDRKYYYPLEQTENSLNIMEKDFPQTSLMSLIVPHDQKLAIAPTEERSITAVHYPDLCVNYTANRNMLAFCESYPESSIVGDPYTKWSFYANTPLSDYLKDRIYPALKSAVAGKSQRDAANILIDFCESIPYGYDDKIWGGDRAFFAEETLYYPQSDCEDHAILFSRLVRDLMGLDVALVYYPGHLATAVHFTEDVEGSYIMHNNRRYTVCDPTIFYAPVGTTMKNMNNNEAVMILLD